MVTVNRKPQVLVVCFTGWLLGVGYLYAQQQIADSKAIGSRVVTGLSIRSLAFTKNLGQLPDSIMFRIAANGATMWFTKNGIWYQFIRVVERSKAFARAIDPAGRLLPYRMGHDGGGIETTMIKAEFVGASESIEVIGLEKQE